MAMDFFGGKTNLETLNRKQILTLLFSAFVSYFVMIMCGTLGAPSFVNKHLMECSPSINNCTLTLSLRNQIQVCQSTADFETANSKDQEINLSFLFGLKDSAKDVGGKAFLNATVAIYDSMDRALMDFCTTEWITIGKDHLDLESKYNVASISRNDVIEVTGCPQLQETTDESSKDKKNRQLGINSKTGLCDVIKMAKIPKQSNEFSMIKIEFNELEDQTLLNAANVAEYVGVEFKSKNDELRVYQAHLTLVFFLVNFINFVFYCYKLTQVAYSEIGTVKMLILYGLGLVMLYNLPYKLFYETELLLYDTFINSLTETFMLFLNLVLSHGMYASTDINKKLFYAPKILISLMVFLGLWAWSYADALEYKAFIQKDFEVDQDAINFERGCFTIFLLLLIIYAVIAAYFSIRALSAKSIRASGSNRFQDYAGGLILIVSMCTASLVVFPFES